MLDQAGREATPMDELIERMEEAADALYRLSIGRDTAENLRLMAKREGVLLALSYAREEVRRVQ